MHSGAMETVRLVFQADPEFARRIDDWRFTHRIPTQAEAIRKLIVGALDAQITLNKVGQPVLPQSRETP